MKKITLFTLAFGFMAVLSGCGSSTVSTTTTAANANFFKSADGGVSWNPEEKIDATTNIASADVLSMAINPVDPNNLYIGTASNGIFETKDGAQTWVKIAFPNSVYGLAIDPQNPSVIYAAGVLGKRGKIYKKENEQSDWKEIYTEPADGTFISALTIDKTNPQILYAGTSAGVIIKTSDGGGQWVNLRAPDATGSGVAGTIASIAIDAANPLQVYFAVFQKGLFVTKDGGTTLTDLTSKMKTDATTSTGAVYVALADPYAPGVLYVGTDKGILKGTNSGDIWSALNIIGSSQQFPIRAIAINPKNSKELIYSTAKAIYKSVDSGTQWSTFQLDSAKSVSALQYDPNNPATIYAGLRKM